MVVVMDFGLTHLEVLCLSDDGDLAAARSRAA